MISRVGVAWFAAGLMAFTLSCSGGGGGGSTTSSSGGSSSGGSSSGGSSSGGTGNTSAIDGTWDITAAGDGTIGASEMTIASGAINGKIVGRDEGKDNGAGCTHTKDRAEFSLSFEGNSLAGTITEISEWSSGAGCPQSRTPKTTAITGSRAAAATGQTSLEGEWEVQIGDEDPFVVAITGLTAKAWDKEDKAKGREPTTNVSVAGGNATVTSNDDDLTFAARKR